MDMPPCAQEVAEIYQMPREVLQAVRAVEGGWTGAIVGPQAGNTYDHGLMQINSYWIPLVAPFGVTREALAWDDCVNISIGAWILRYQLRRYGNMPDALSAYHAGHANKKRGRAYAKKVLNLVKRLRR